MFVVSLSGYTDTLNAVIQATNQSAYEDCLSTLYRRRQQQWQQQQRQHHHQATNNRLCLKQINNDSVTIIYTHWHNLLSDYTVSSLSCRILLARVATLYTALSSRSSSLTFTKLLRQLQWLPIEWRIKFKLLQYHKSTRSTCSSAAYFQFHATTFYLVLVLFVSLHRGYGITYLLTFCSLKHSLHLAVI